MIVIYKKKYHSRQIETLLRNILMIRKRLRTIFASEIYRTKSIIINLNIIMEQLKHLSTKLKVSIMGGLPLIGGG